MSDNYPIPTDPDTFVLFPCAQEIAENKDRATVTIDGNVTVVGLRWLTQEMERRLVPHVEV